MSKKRWKFGDFCQSCRMPLNTDEKIVYVEESTHRFFCSEKCIRDYYDPMAEAMKEQLFDLRDPHDIPEADFSNYESYAPLCLSNPDEVWEEVLANGESYTIFMANFSNESGKFTYIVVAFCLEYEPTYILLSFPTKDKRILEEFRIGTRVELETSEEEALSQETAVSSLLASDYVSNQGDAIQDEMMAFRSQDDIPKEEFEDYQHLLEQTIEGPDEVWELLDPEGNTLLTLISQADENVSYVVICTLDEAEDGQQESWRVVYSFPTKDPALVQRYRRGVPREGGGAKASFLH
ncbi:MAG: PBECR2 nuclease fold domain-containing protein [Oligoflexia bacterium]|nr:PBECR2 nuclease fold domain-containing protein [Oligoflexia bacterium]